MSQGQGPGTADKEKSVGVALRMLLAIFNSTEFGGEPKYVGDMNCGSGWNLFGGYSCPGSPLVILEAFEDTYTGPYTAFFCDKKKTYVDTLRRRVASRFPDGLRGECVYSDRGNRKGIGEFANDIAGVFLGDFQPKRLIVLPGRRHRIAKLLHQGSVVIEDVLRQIIAQANQFPANLARVQASKFGLDVR